MGGRLLLTLTRLAWRGGWASQHLVCWQLTSENCGSAFCRSGWPSRCDALAERPLTREVREAWPFNFCREAGLLLGRRWLLENVGLSGGARCGLGIQGRCFRLDPCSGLRLISWASLGHDSYFASYDPILGETNVLCPDWSVSDVSLPRTRTGC